MKQMAEGKGQRAGGREQKAESRKQRVLPYALCHLRFTLVLLVTILITGCTTNHKEIKTPIDYFDILSQMTKSQQVIDRLDTKLVINATYKSWSLREAYIYEYAKRYQLDADMAEKLMETEKGLEERFNEFFIAAYTPNDEWNDFAQPLSIWKIYMEDEKGNRSSPVEIKKVDVDSPFMREFYPYLDYWSSGYIVKFPKYISASNEPFPKKDSVYLKLIVTGVLGNTELEWPLIQID